ncbi:hypothetical protein EYF80_061332 [Liparis tanakae]|uniref:Uncharacterized protein n=1 Tax=Liparis tanakae TaxID=230148 RepID=A0A4Z2EIS7_9TELE|nr:hypothetical protein EYF80_061332 [Liparis tanakae]
MEGGGGGWRMEDGGWRMEDGGWRWSGTQKSQFSHIRTTTETVRGKSNASSSYASAHFPNRCFQATMDRCGTF